MSELNLEGIELEGFKSFKTKQYFPFHPGTGIGFVLGKNLVHPRLKSNGSGKSTILDAWCWCWYGKTLRGVKGPSVVSWGKRNRNTEVTTYLKGTSIQRSRNPNKLILGGSVVDQADLESYIGLSFEEFRHSVIIGQFITFFTDLQASARADLFTKVLGADVWREYSASASDTVVNINNHKRTLENKAIKFETKLEGLEGSSDLKDLDEVWEEDKKILLTKKSKECLQLKEEIKKDKAALKKVMSKKHMTQEQVFRVTRQSADISKYLNATQAKKVASERAASVIKGKLSVVKDQLEELLEVRGRCHVCGQKVSELHKKAESRRFSGTINKMEKRLIKVITERDQALAVVLSAQRDSSSVFGKLRSKERKLDTLQNEEDLLKERIEEFGIELRECRTSLNSLKESTSPYLEKISRNLKRSVLLKEKLQKIRLKISKLNKKEANTFFWVKGFKDIRGFLINEILLQLELEVNSVIEGLGLTGWVMKFIPTELKSSKTVVGFDIQVYPPQSNTPVIWESWCGGETSRLRLAAQLGLSNLILNRKGVKVNVQAFDEPTNWVGGEGVEAIMHTLKSWAQDNKRWVWVIDHRTLAYQFDAEVEVVKKRMGSEIRQRVN